MESPSTIGGRLLALLASLAPALLIAPVLHALGSGRIPGSVVRLALVAGGFATLSAILPTYSVLVFRGGTDAGLPEAIKAFVLAGLFEEGTKLILLLVLVLRHYEADRPRDAIFAAAWVGLGFALVENFFYVTDADRWLLAGAVRLATAVPCHVQLGLIMGWLLGRAGTVRRALPAALLLPTFLHGLYDVPAFRWREASMDSEALSLFYAGILVVAVVAIAFFVCGPVARAIRALPPPAGAADDGRHRMVTAAAVAAWLMLAGGGLAIPVAAIASTAYDSDLAPMIALGVLPLAFGILWLRARPRESGAATPFPARAESLD